MDLVRQAITRLQILQMGILLRARRGQHMACVVNRQILSPKKDRRALLQRGKVIGKEASIPVTEKRSATITATPGTRALERFL